MDRMLYVAMAGAEQTLRAQALTAHNLSNTNTIGFREDISDFRNMPVFGQEGLPTRAYAMAERTRVDYSPGKIITTGRDLDVAIQGDGWLAIQSPSSAEAYTRGGELQLTGEGMLTTARGEPVIGNSGPISLPPTDKIEIAADGTISVKLPGGDAVRMAVIDRLRLVKPSPENPMYKGKDGLMYTDSGTVAPADSSVRVIAGTLEGSNVNPAGTLVSMIEDARRYELQIKMMSAAQDNTNSSDSLLKME